MPHASDLANHQLIRMNGLPSWCLVGNEGLDPKESLWGAQSLTPCSLLSTSQLKESPCGSVPHSLRVAQEELRKQLVRQARRIQAPVREALLSGDAFQSAFGTAVPPFLPRTSSESETSARRKRLSLKHVRASVSANL